MIGFGNLQGALFRLACEERFQGVDLTTSLKVGRLFGVAKARDGAVLGRSERRNGGVVFSLDVFGCDGHCLDTPLLGLAGLMMSPEFSTTPNEVYLSLNLTDR